MTNIKQYLAGVAAVAGVLFSSPEASAYEIKPT